MELNISFKITASEAEKKARTSDSDKVILEGLLSDLYMRISYQSRVGNFEFLPTISQTDLYHFQTIKKELEASGFVVSDILHSSDHVHTFRICWNSPKTLKVVPITSLKVVGED